MKKPLVAVEDAKSPKAVEGVDKSVPSWWYHSFVEGTLVLVIVHSAALLMSFDHNSTPFSYNGVAV
jgi:hypothetical protein